MKRVLVTGAASGIGAACTDVLAREGWDVVRVDLHAADGIVPLDVTDEAGWERVMATFGPLDGLITCADIRTRSMIVDTSLDDWERHLRVNVTGTWLAIRAFLCGIPRGDVTPRAIVTIASVNATIAVPGQAHDVASKGAIASVNATIAVPGQAHYVASKGAIASLTRAVALEGAPLGVRANAIAPGPIDTPMAGERLADPEQVSWLTGRVPLGRVGQPEEIGELAEFLLSARASYISGEVIYADGGWAANAV